MTAAPAGLAHPTVLVHGGAGAWTEGTDAALAACRRAVAAGVAVLDAGGSAVDAAVAAVEVLEDDPACNAGTGAVPTTAGTYELDACVMDGASRRSGAVTCLQGWANPVRVARAVLDDGRWHLLAGEGAAGFARDRGLAADGPSGPPPGAPAPPERGNTVGAVALDADGALAAATSTGGVAGQIPGRVGDSPIVGGGTYADERAACSCTGDGESFARASAALRAVTAASGPAAGRSLDPVAGAVLDLVRDGWQGIGGLIVLRSDGSLGRARTMAAMPHAWGGPGRETTAGV